MLFLNRYRCSPFFLPFLFSVLLLSLERKQHAARVFSSSTRNSVFFLILSSQSSQSHNCASVLSCILAPASFFENISKMHMRHLLLLPILGLEARTVARNIVELQPGHHTSQSVHLPDGNVTPHLLMRGGDGVRCGPGVGTCSDGKCCSTAGSSSSVLVQPCAYN